jgi:hypothetical protein
MSHDLSHSLNPTPRVRPHLIVPVTLFEVDGEYKVTPSAELLDADVIVVHEYDSHAAGPAH